jgi:membrane protein
LPVRIALGAGLTVVGGFGIVVGVVAIVGGTLMTTELADRAGIGAATWMAMSILRWPLAFAALVFAVMALFRYGSCVRSPWRWAAAGASAFAVAWIAVTFGFGLYVERLGNFDVTYGALGGVIVLMLWYYLTAIILLAAAELVALLAVTFDRDKPQDLEKIGVAPRDLEAESGEALSTPEEQQPTLPPPASPQPTPPPPHQPQ